MLEPHLKRKAGASQSDVGLTFLILGGVYMISSPIGGLVSLQVFVLNSSLVFSSVKSIKINIFRKRDDYESSVFSDL